MILLKFILKVLRKVYFFIYSKYQKHKDEDRLQGYQSFSNVELFNQNANDYIRELLSKDSPCMISKFGTVELNALLSYRMILQKHYSLKDYLAVITLNVPNLWWSQKIDVLCSNAGFFPNDVHLLKIFYQENLDAMKQIDILGSYIPSEKYFDSELATAKRVNLDGYYAPFFWKNPWTKILRGKKVLVVHPFAEDIEKQYVKREFLWQDHEVLPEFSLITYKAIQSMLGIKTEYNTWFDALQKMKNDISKLDFDIALIGCGAYGMPLAAHIKKLGKQAIHLAGWTQILFGIIGKRWENNPQCSCFINEYWIHPSEKFIPQNAKKIENGCYW